MRGGRSEADGGVLVSAPEDVCLGQWVDVVHARKPLEVVVGRVDCGSSLDREAGQVCESKHTPSAAAGAAARVTEAAGFFAAVRAGRAAQAKQVQVIVAQPDLAGRLEAGFAGGPLHLLEQRVVDPAHLARAFAAP